MGMNFREEHDFVTQDFERGQNISS